MRSRHIRRSRLARGVLAVALTVLALGLQTAHPALAAADTLITTCNESNLDAAVTAAQGDAAGGTITFSCPNTTIQLLNTIAITGTGAVTIDGTGQGITIGVGAHGVNQFSIAAGSELSLIDMTVSGGF